MRISLLSACVVAAAVAGAAQTIEVLPQRVMADESAVIRAKGLDAGERVAIRARLVDGAAHAWTSQAEFIADGQGVVDASKQAPVAGSYKDVSAMGLIWSMLPDDKKTTAAYQAPRDLAPQIIELVLLRKGEQVSTVRLEHAILGEGVRRMEVRDDGLRGVLFLPASKERRPGVLVVGGSNGGLPLRPAAWLASRGYAALALAYFRYDDLPAKLEAIPLEYFQRALAWMIKRPEIAPDRLAVMGTSRGGELALQLGSMFRVIHAVVAYVPANVRFPACCGDNDVPYAWTWTGRPLPYLPLRAMRQPEMAARAAIEVEKTQGPVLMISGEDDHVWMSAEMADAVVHRLKAAHFPYSFENLKYAHAGHSAGRPEIVPAWHSRLRHPVSGREMDLGGSAEGDARSSLDAMPRVLKFLEQSLGAAKTE